MVPRILTSTLGGGGWSALRPDRITHDTHWTEGWVVPRAGLNSVWERQMFLVFRDRNLIP
jgi:hypothetical protein